MNRSIYEYQNNDNCIQIVTLDTAEIEKVMLPKTIIQFEAYPDQSLEIKPLDGDIDNIISYRIPCSQLVITSCIITA